MDDIRRAHQAAAPSRRETLVRFASVAAVAAVVVITVALTLTWARGGVPNVGASVPPASLTLQTLSQEPVPSAPPGAATNWTGPVRTDFGPALVDGMSWSGAWDESDADDARPSYVNITQSPARRRGGPRGAELEPMARLLPTAGGGARPKRDHHLVRPDVR
jgi:hypothetical protein